jgi:hypothetical protein
VGCGEYAAIARRLRNETAASQSAPWVGATVVPPHGAAAGRPRCRRCLVLGGGDPSVNWLRLFGRLLRTVLLGERVLRGCHHNVPGHGHGQLHGHKVVSGAHDLRRGSLPDRLYGHPKLSEHRLLLGRKLRPSASHAHLQTLALLC